MGALKEFAINLFLQTNTSTRNIFKMADKNPELIIDIAFTWNSTPEGFEYWKDMSILWKRYCDKCKVVGIEDVEKIIEIEW